MRYSLSRVIFCSWLMIITGFGLFGQTVFKPGYIVNNQGDSIKGFVGDAFWKLTPEWIEFKTSQQSSLEKFTPSDVKGFGFEGLAFESQNVSVNRIFTSEEKFVGTPEIQYSERQIFLENLVDGPKSLYQYKDKLGVARYYIKKDEAIELLLFQEFLQITADGKIERTIIKKYAGQLFAYLSACSSIETQIKRTNYKQKSLILLFKKYYACGEVDSENVQYNGGVIKPIFSVIVGGTSTKLEFVEARAIGVENTDFPRGISFAIGGSAEYFLSRRRRASIDLNLLYSRFNTEGENSVETIGRTDLTTSSLGYTSVRLKVLYKYYFPIASQRMFLSVGASIGTLSFSHNRRILQRVFASLTLESASPVLSEPLTYYGGQIIGFGTKVRNYSFELRNEFGGNLGVDTEFNKVKTSRLYLLIGYRIQ